MLKVTELYNFSGHGNNDTFNAVMFAIDLMFRPGATRNFILVPCSPCKTHFMEVSTNIF